MKTDSLFYRIFHTLPEIFFALTGFDYSPADYQFQAIEIKQTSFRLDGIFKPIATNPTLPTIFVEVQFQADGEFYSRFFSEIFLYLRQYPQRNPCKAVVIYPERKTETDDIYRYGELINVASISRIYLHENLNQAATNWQLSLLKLIIADVKTVPALAKNLITTLAVQNSPQDALLDLIETIVTYKFPHLTREEVKKMIHIPDIHLDLRTTQFYKDVFAEGQLKGKQEAEKEIILNLLQRRFGTLNGYLVENIINLSEVQLSALLDKLLDFKQLDEVGEWLKQLNH